MTQILDNVPNGKDSNIICCYVNATSQIQIARVTNVQEWYFERVVFPGQRLVFEAPTEAILEIHTGMMASAILSDTIPCRRLALHALTQDQEQFKRIKQTNVAKNQPLSINEPGKRKQVAQSVDIAV